MIVLVCGEKGGTGKTTLATSLAAMRAGDGRDVLLLDTDPQGSASAWAATRGADDELPRVACVQKFGRGLAKEVLDLAKRYDDIVIDAGGRDSVEMRAAMTVADHAVSPVQPSQLDLWTVQPFADLVEQAVVFNPELKVALLISRAPTQYRIKDEGAARELLADYAGTLHLADAVTHDRQAWRRAAATGHCVTELGTDSKAADELRAVFRTAFLAE